MPLVAGSPRSPISPPDVDDLWNRLKVGGVHTRLYSAEVIDDEAIRDGAVVFGVGKSVSGGA